MEVNFNQEESCFVAVYLNGQVNVYDKMLKAKDLDNKEIVLNILNKINKKQNYFPNKMQIVKAILVIEEK